MFQRLSSYLPVDFLSFNLVSQNFLPEKKTYFSLIFALVILLAGNMFSSNGITWGSAEEEYYLVKYEDGLIAALETSGEVENLKDYIEELKGINEEETGYEVEPKDELVFENAVEREIRSKYGKDLNELKDIMGISYAKREAERKVEFVTEAFIMEIENEHQIALESKTKADEILEEVKSKYTSKYEEEENVEIMGVSIMESVEVYPQEVFPSEIKSSEEAVEYIMDGGDTEDNIEEDKGNENVRNVYSDGEKANVEDNSINDEIEAIKELDEIEDVELDDMVGEEDESVINVRFIKNVYEEEVIPFDEIEKDCTSLEVGERKVEESGEEGKQEVTYRVIVDNDIELNKEKIEEKVLEKPQDKVVLKGSNPGVGTGEFIWPVDSNVGHISSPYGYRSRGFHSGVDHAASQGTTIRAADNGVVEFSGYRGQYGKLIIIDHSNGYKTYYAHNTANYVTEGDVVEKGEAIGEIGATGNATGAHLHFELHRDGSHVDPYDYVRP